MSDKETIFISHRSPVDNYFSTWLATKLKMLGYKVWLELDELSTGDAFWPKIDDAIRNRSIKFLAIISTPYLNTISNPLTGVFKELCTADRIKGVKNFKVPITIDPLTEDNFPPQLIGLNGIDFSANWQTGLEKLVGSFVKEDIAQNDTSSSPLAFWKHAFNLNDSINNEPEKIYTNWFPYQLPQKLFVHTPFIKSMVDLADIAFPYIEYNGRHICFFPKEDYPPSIAITASAAFDISSILDQLIVPVDDFMVLNEPRKKIIELAAKSFDSYLYQSGLKKYEQSKGLIFYFPPTREHATRINLKRFGKTSVSVVGKVKANRWSFAISLKASLHPSPNFRIGSHIIFETEDNLVLDPEEQHSLRRKFGFDWYNRDWLDTLLGIMIKISKFDPDGLIKIPVSSSEYLTIEVSPLSVIAGFGYSEPAKEETVDE